MVQKKKIDINSPEMEKEKKVLRNFLVFSIVFSVFFLPLGIFFLFLHYKETKKFQSKWGIV